MSLIKTVPIIDQDYLENFANIQQPKKLTGAELRLIVRKLRKDFHKTAPKIGIEVLEVCGKKIPRPTLKKQV